MQELLAREEEHNKRLLKPFLDEVWSGEIPKSNIIVFGRYGVFDYFDWPNEGRWTDCRYPAAKVTRESMERALLDSLRHARPISTGGIHTETTMIVDSKRPYISEAIDAICTSASGDESPITGLSFLRWEDEIRLWQEIVDERLTGNQDTLRRASALLRCSARWLQRMHACEAWSTRVIFPAQLALAETVHPLNQ